MHDGFLVVVLVLRVIMLIIKYQLAPTSVKISSKVPQCASVIANHSLQVFCSQ